MNKSTLIKFLSVSALALSLGACGTTGSPSNNQANASATKAGVTEAQRTEALEAARLNKADALTALLAQGVEVNAKTEKGTTLLIAAAQENALDTVKVLLNAKADLAAREKSGDSALMKAIMRENDPQNGGGLEKSVPYKAGGVVEALLKAGAPVNYESGWTPVLYAAYVGNDALLERLIAAGGNVKAVAPNGGTTLMFAARNGHMSVVQRLLKMGVDVNAKNSSGQTAEVLARQAKNTEIADLIKSGGMRK